MAARTNAENLRKYKTSFSLVLEQILAFASSIKPVSKFQTNCVTMFYVFENSRLDS